jgi:hypothetical protein
MRNKRAYENGRRLRMISRRQFARTSVATVTTLVATGRSSPGLTSAADESTNASIGQMITQRAPLAQVPFLALPLGSVQARGWLLAQLELQRDGLTGHADEVLPGLDINSSAWLNPKLEKGEDWEKGPYYAKGLVPLAFTLKDENLKAKAAAWVDAILSSKRDDGFYGPRNDDWWPRIVTNYLLRDYYEATSDARVLRFLGAYYAHLQAHLPNRPLKDWGRARAGDEIDTVFWLYNRTGDAALLKLADLLHEQAYPWREIFTNNAFLGDPSDFHPKHAVNVAQALKMPAVYSQRSKAAADRDAYQLAINHLTADHGTSFGINTGTEFLSGKSTVEGVELCAIAEKMLSAATVLRILGDPTIGDDLELLAFNALPAAISKPFRQHVYYSLANNISATRGLVGYEIDYDDGRTPAPRSGCPCCCYNLHMAWPKLVQNAWAATPSGGLAALIYVPSEVSAPVARGNVARVKCTTNYPFEESISLAVDVDAPTRFPLHLRIPAWCDNPRARINGRGNAIPRSDKFFVVDRTWAKGDAVELNFPMSISTRRGVNNSISIRRGPLVFSLAMEEQWAAIEPGKRPGFESFAVTTSTPWNFALDIDETNPSKSIEVFTTPLASNPFERGKASPRLKLSAKKLAAWKMRRDGLLALDPPISPTHSEAPSEQIELVPFGSQMLRVTDFPLLGNPIEPPREWHDRFSERKLDEWLIYRGGYLRHQQLHLVKGAKAIVNTLCLAELRFEATIEVGETGDAGVIFRVSEPSIGIDQYKGYYVGVDAAAQAVVIGKADNRWIQIARQAAPIRAGHPHRLQISALGRQLQVLVDEAEVALIEIDDPPISEAMIGVRSFSSFALFSRLRATSL